ncbi:MAG: hypothetical protein AAFR88_08645 [Pseudomonadota bacterium]
MDFPMRFSLRRLFLAFAIFATLAPFASSPAAAKTGFEPDRIARASSLKEGYGALVISVRSELFLLAELDVFFVREGGDLANDADVFRVSRSQSAFAMGNSTAKHAPRYLQLPAGRYRLAGHGSKCPKVPAPDERCLADVKFAGIGETVSFPSRGYGDDAPVIEVVAGRVTYGGDFALTARNTIEWSALPPKHRGKAERRFKSLAAGPPPEVAENYRLKFPLRARSMSDDRGRRY